jgi:phage terminase Nu1 subunit (DNA packaging protein)
MNTEKPQKPNIVEMARKRRHVKILEKLHKGEAPTKSEIKELADYEGGQPDPGIVDNQDQVAHVFGVSVRTVQHWVKDGMPVMKGGKYDIKEIQAWKFLRKKGPKSRKSAEAIAENWENKYREYKAKLAEIDLKKAMGELIPKAAAKETLKSLVRAFKKKVLAMPRQLSIQLEGLDAVEIQEALELRINQILTEFSKGKF